jgi:two-component system chemotaxis response regulator CheB
VNFDYEIYGIDLDPISISKAQKNWFPIADLNSIPVEYRQYVKQNNNGFSVNDSVFSKCHFHVLDANQTDKIKMRFDVVISRNLLIYFDPIKVEKLVSDFDKLLVDSGIMVLGHSESSAMAGLSYRPMGSSCYRKLKAADVLPIKSGMQKILIVEDVPAIRVPLKTVLQKGGFQVFEAGSAEEADALMAKNKFDLVSLDLQLPGENGVQWLKRQRSLGFKSPIVIVSASDPSEAEAVFGALENGAQEYFTKDTLFQNLPIYLNTIRALTTVRNLSVSKGYVTGRKFDFEPDVIVVGASTGGPDTIWNLFKDIKKPCPPVVIVQHTSPYFAKQFAEAVAKTSGLILGKLDEPLQSNHVYLSTGDYHIEVKSFQSKLRAVSSDTQKVHGHRASVDVLFQSAAATRKNILAILLTGMGVDGAMGMKVINQLPKSFTIAQSADSCAVFGMPREAIDKKAVDLIADPREIRELLLKFLSQKSRAAA